MSLSSSSSRYYRKPPYGPAYYPEYFPIFEDVEEYCDCSRVTSSCKESEECFKPTIKYLKHHCNAIVTCDSMEGNVRLETNKESILSEGVGISKLIQCRRRKWTAKDIHDDVVRFKGLRCLFKVAREE
uniref:Uncharacterized protein n=1 Tax=Angiostrongylus cantonensis TaxID=6313 RepID=A0A0K0D8Z8_ANGCA